MATNIYTAINAIMSEVGAIKKEQKNQQQGFMYRGVDVVMNVLQPLFVKHGVCPVPRVLNHTREERTTKSGGNLIYSILDVEYTFYALDGSHIVAAVTGEGMDSGDKASNKAMSVAFKYACFQVLCIPTEAQDPDGDTPEESAPKAEPSKKTAAPKPPESSENILDVPLFALRSEEYAQYLAALVKGTTVTKKEIKSYIDGLGKEKAAELTDEEFEKLVTALKEAIANEPA